MVKHQVKGRVLDGILYKNSRQAVKFWQHDGYGIKVRDLHNVDGVVIDTRYDGKLYASATTIQEYGIPHTFNGDEEQLILKVKYWRGVR